MKRIIAIMLAVVLVLSMAACGSAETPETSPSTSPSKPADTGLVTELGEGSVTFYFDVQDVDGTVTKFKINTDAKTVGQALVALKLIQGSQGDYGLYVTVVNGISADYAKDGAYWAFYVNGEASMTGVDAVDVVAGESYSFVKTPA